MQITSVMKRLLGRLRREDGYTLVELITVMAILGIVLAPLSSSFASGMVAQASQNRREQAYANARVALQRLRLDVHCASAVTSVEQNSYGGFTLTLTESNDQSPAAGAPPSFPRVPRRPAFSGARFPTLARRPDSSSIDSSGRIRPTATAALARRSRRATSLRSRARGRRTRLRLGAWEWHPHQLGWKPLADIDDVPERVPAHAGNRFQRQRRSCESSERALRDEGFDHAPQRPSLHLARADLHVVL